VVLIVPEGKGLVMYKMRYPYEIRSVEDVPGLTDVDNSFAGQVL